MNKIKSTDMITIGLIREGKIPQDNRVALSPQQCRFLKEKYPRLHIKVQSSPTRCFSDQEYIRKGIEVADDISDCDILFGIKEVPIDQLIPHKTYFFFSHTIKQQPYNQKMFRAILERKITLLDYERLVHEDGQRILGFGFFAGVVGAHNGMMAYGNRTGAYQLVRVYQQRNLEQLIHTYFGLRIPPVKIAVTGSGRVAHGILEVMNLMGVLEVEPADYLKRNFTYPVYTQLKGADLYRHKKTGEYTRDHFHEHADEYICKFKDYISETDILMNGIYWDNHYPRLFAKEDIREPWFRIKTISDITDDKDGSVPINLGDQTIEDPVYGVSTRDFSKTPPYEPDSIDVVAVGNLPNELPRDASKYFGEQLIKFVIDELVHQPDAEVLQRATIVREGVITPEYEYLKDYGSGKII